MRPDRSIVHMCNSHGDPVNGEGIHSPYYQFMIMEGLPQLQSSVASHNLEPREGIS